MTKRSKYAPGRLHIVLFDQLGVKQKTKVMKSDNLMRAVAWATKKTDKNPGWSFSILRVVNNSLTSKHWEPEKSND